MFDNRISTPEVIAEVAAGQGKPIAFLARSLPALRGTNPTHPATITRWILRGVPGPAGGRIHLEAVRLASRWVSTEAAVRRFLARQSHHSDPDARMTAPTAAKRSRAADRAAKELEGMGV